MIQRIIRSFPIRASKRQRSHSRWVIIYNTVSSSPKKASRKKNKANGRPTQNRRKRNVVGEERPSKTRRVVGLSLGHSIVSSGKPQEEKGPGPCTITQTKEYYWVERVIGASVAYGQQAFLIKWAGYELDMCTWEPDTAVKQSTEAIQEFFKSHEYVLQICCYRISDGLLCSAILASALCDEE